MTTLPIPSTTFAELNTYFRRWKVRTQWINTLRWLPRTLFLGSSVAIALAISSRIWPLLTRFELAIASAVIIFLSVLIVVVWCWLWPRPKILVARRLERALNLQERLSTALEIQSGRILTSVQLTEYQMRDTLHRAAAATPATALPIQLNGKELLLVALSLIMLFALILLPNAQEAARLWNQQQQFQLSSATAALEEARGSVLAENRLSPEERERLLRALDEAVASLENDAISREEAVASLYDAAQQLEQGQASLNAQSAAVQDSLSEASDALRRGEDRSSPDRPQTLSERLQQMRDELSSLTAEQIALMARALRESAEAFAETHPDLASALEAAAEALERGDLNAADDAMADAIFELEALEAPQNQAPGDARSMDHAADRLSDAAEELAEGSDSSQFRPGGENSQGSETGREGSEGNQAAVGQIPQGDSRESSVRGSHLAESNNPSSESSVGQTAGAGDVTSGQSGDVSASSGGDQSSGGNNPDGTGRDNYNTIYAPRERIGGSSEIGIELEAGSSEILVDSGEFSENPLGESRIPYTLLYHEYRESANAALETEYIPLGLRAVIRSYFSAIEPDTE